MNGCNRFLLDDTGAVTVDWVVLTSGLAVLAIIAMTPIQAGITEMAGYIGETVAEYHKFLEE
jgi:Flp pilus assembly pilin Flp